VRGSKTRKTIIPTNLKEICALYDELIVSTEGYSIGGTATGDTRKEMDAIHKKVVVMGLFAPAFADETAKVSDGTN
jgi:hypothetical protein